MNGSANNSMKKCADSDMQDIQQQVSTENSNHVYQGDSIYK